MIPLNSSNLVIGNFQCQLYGIQKNIEHLNKNAFKTLMPEDGNKNLKMS